MAIPVAGHPLGNEGGGNGDVGEVISLGEHTRTTMHTYTVEINIGQCSGMLMPARCDSAHVLPVLVALVCTWTVLLNCDIERIMVK